MSESIDLGIEGLSPAVHLGAGGSANVFAATILATGEHVAVKLLRASADSDQERERFAREKATIDLLAGHDGIVHVIDAGVTDRREPYFLMPLMEGSLQDRIDKSGALSWEMASQLVAEVADTVEFAHTQKVLHRDLKPGNILLDVDGVPRVADFGIAKLVDSSVSKSSKALGTPSFMPPERFRAIEATPATDVYGLGATLTALLTGHAPFVTGANDTDAAVMMRVLSEEPPALRDHGVPDAVADVVAASMAKNPEDRPSSAAEFARLLRTATLESGGVPSEGPMTVAVARRELELPTVITVVPDVEAEEQKRPVWMLTAAAALFFALLGIGGLMAVNLRNDAATQHRANGGLDSIELVAGDATETVAAADGGGNSDVPGDGNGDVGGDGATGDATTAGEGSVPGGPAAGPELDNDLENDGADTTDVVADVVTEVSGAGEAAPQVSASTTTVSKALTATTAGPTTTKPTPTTQPTATTEKTATTKPTATTAPIATTTPIAAPKASFTVSSHSVEVGDNVQFTSTSTGQITSTSWKFGDGGAASGSTAWHSYNNHGTYTVELRVSGPGGHDTATRTITVDQPPVVAPAFTKVVEMGDFGDDFVRFRFTTNVTTGYTVRIRNGSNVAKSQSGTAYANSMVSLNMGGLAPGTDYTLQVRLDGPPAVDSSSVGFRTSGGVATPATKTVTLDNLRYSDVRSDRFQVNYESNICANGSFVIREQGGAVVGSNAGQSNGCTTTHVGVPGFFTAKLKPNTTYVITLTVEADGQGKGNGNTASKSITVTTTS